MDICMIFPLIIKNKNKISGLRKISDNCFVDKMLNCSKNNDQCVAKSLLQCLGPPNHLVMFLII